MQLRTEQVERTLADLRDRSLHEVDRATDSDELPDDESDPVSSAVAERLSEMPAIRPEAIARARRHLEEGKHPSDDELAWRVIGRLVCDRLR
jgi:hypothetical protein